MKLSRKIEKVLALVTLFSFSVSLVVPANAIALPTEDKVVKGNVTFDRSQDGVLNITSDSKKSIINYKDFSIGSNETVNFFLPNAKSLSLNRVIGNSGSDILGTLTANGRLILVNPNGINFGSSANVRTGGLIASTLDISDANFLNNKYLFSQDNAFSSVTNQGNISADEFAVLIGSAVDNQGVIQVPLGKVALASGDVVTLGISDSGLVSVAIDEAASHQVLDAYGNSLSSQIANSGLLEANGGTVILTAQSFESLFQTAINQTGIIRANSVTNTNGTVEITASGASAELGGSLETSNFHITEGTTVNANDAQLTVAKDWINEGNFNGGTSTVTFTDASRVSNISGDNTFYDFSVITPNKILAFEAGSLQTILGTWKTQGAYGEHVRLLSQTPGEQWLVDPRGARDLTYTWVEDSYNINSDIIIMTESTNRGGSFNWDPVGTWTNGNATGIWSDSGNWSGLGGATPGAGDDILFNGTSIASSSVDGAFSINSLNLSTGYTGILGLSGALTLAGSFTQTSGTISLGSNTLTVGGAFTKSGGTFNGDTGTVDFNGAGTQLLNSGGASFYDIDHSGANILRLSGTTLVVANDFTNSNAAGTFDLNGQNWTMTGATMTNVGTIQLQGAETVTGLVAANMDLTQGTWRYIGDIDGNADTFTIKNFGAGTDYFNLTLNDVAGEDTFQALNAVNIDGNFTLSGGLFSGGSQTINVAGNMDATGLTTFLAGTSTFIFDGAAQSLTNAGIQFNNFNYSGSGTLTVNDALVVNGNTTLNGPTISAADTLTFGDSAADTTTLSSAVSITTSDDIVTFNSAVTGNKDLTINSGTAATNFNAAVSNLGDGTGAALTTTSTGLTRFFNTLGTNSGLNVTGPVRFDGDVTLGDGDTNTTLNGDVTLDGLTITTNDIITFGDAGTDQITLSGGAVVVNSTNDDITFLGKIDGTQTLSVGAGSGNVFFGGLIGSVTPILGLTVTSANAATFNAASVIAGSLAVTATNINMNTALTTTSGGTATFTNSGTLFVDPTADMNLDGAFNQNGTGPVTLGGDITTTNDAVSFSGAVTLTNDLAINTGAGAGDITFSDILNGTTAGLEDLTLTAGTGSIFFTGIVGGVTRLGILLINSALNVTATDITAASIKQNAGTGTTTFNGALNTNTAAGIDLTGNNFTVNNSVTTTSGGIFEVTNAGTFTTAAAGDMNLDGSFTQNGAGSNSIAGDITTTNDNVSFLQDITLTGNVAFNAGSATVIFNDNIADGGFTATVKSDLQNEGAHTGTGRILLSGGASAHDLSGAGTYTNLELNDANGALQNVNLIINGTFKVSGGTFGSNGFNTTVTGLETIQGGTFLGNSGTHTLNGGLTVSSGTFSGQTSDLDVNGNVTISGTGTLIAPDATGSFTVSGNWTNAGTSTFTHNSGLVTFDGAGSQDVTSGGDSFFDLTHSGTGTLTQLDAMAVADDLLNSTGTWTSGANTLDVNDSFTNSGTAVFNASSTTMNVGGDFLNAGTATFTHNSGLVIFDDAGTQSLNTGGDSFFNLTHSGAGTLDLASNLAVANDLSNTGGIWNSYAFTIDVNGDFVNTVTFNAPSTTMNVAGDYTNSSPFVHSSGTVILDGAGAQALTTGGDAFYNLTHSGTGTVTLMDALNVANNFTNSAGIWNSGANAIDVDNNFSNTGTAAFTAPSTTMNVGNDWTNGPLSTFTHNSGTVIFDGTTQNLTGSTTFNNFTKIAGVPDTMTFQAGSTQTIAGMLTLKGTLGGNSLALRSSVSGTQWNINPQGGRDVTLVDVKDSNNTNITPITATQSGNSGNNLGWLFPPSTLTWTGGTSTNWGLFSNWDLGFVPNNVDNVIIANVTNDPILDMARIMNNLTIDVGGLLSLSGNNITVNGTFANNGTFRLNGNETTTLVQDADSGTWEYVGNGNAAANIFTLKDFVSAGNDYFNLIINMTDAADTMQALGSSNKELAGTFQLQSGIYDTNGLKTIVTGLATVSGGTYQAKGNTQTFNGGLTISGGTFLGATGSVDVNGNLVLSSGTLTAPSKLFTVSGDWTKTGGTFNPGAFIVTFDGAGTQLLNSGGSSFHKISHTGAGTLQLTNNLDINSNLTNSNTFDLNGFNFDMTGATIVNNGTVQLDGDETVTGLVTGGSAGTWSYVGDGVGGTTNFFINNFGSADYFNLVVNPTDAAETFTLAGATVAKGVLTVNNGTLILNGNGLTASKGLVNSSAIRSFGNEVISAKILAAPTAGTWTYLGDNDGLAEVFTIKDFGTFDYFNLVINDGAAVEDTFRFGTAASVAGNFTLTDGTFQLNNQTMTLGGNWTKTGGTFTPGTGTVIFNKAAGTQTLESDGSAFFNLTHSGAGTLQLINDPLTVNGTLLNSAGTLDLNGMDLTTNNLTISGGVLDASAVSVDVNGNLTQSGGVLTAPNTGETFTVGGNWAKTAGTFTSGTGTVTFDRAAGTQTLNSGGSGFNNVVHSGAGTLQLLTNNLTIGGTLTNSAGVFNAGGKSVTVGGLTTVSGGSYLSSTLLQTFNGGLTISGGAFTGAGGPVDVNGNLLLSSGTLTAPTGLFTVSGNWTQLGGTFTPGTGTVTFDGAGTQGLTTINNFNNLTHSGAGTAQLLSNLTVNGTLLNSNGTFDPNGFDVTTLNLTNSGTGTFNADAGSSIDVNGLFALSGGTFNAPNAGDAFTVAGNWNRTGGTFNAGTGTVTLDGANQTIFGSNVFNNLTKTTAVARTLTITAGTTQQILGNLTLQGAAAQLLTLTGSGIWTLDLDGTETLTFLSVKNSNNIGTTTATATSSVNGGGNTGWVITP